MAKKSVVTEAYPKVKVDGKTYELKPTQQAVRQICGAYGGLLTAFRQVNDANPFTSAAVIAFGANLTLEDDEVQKFEEKVWKTPRSDYANGVVKYLGILLNGGKPLDEKADDEDDKTEAEPEKEADQGNG